MANIKRKRKDGTFLVGYRPFPGQPERYGICGSKAEFHAFEALERQHHRDGVEVPSPTVLYGRESRADDEVARDMTLRAWIGAPRSGMPGPYFDYARPMTPDWRALYEGTMETHVYPYLVDASGRELPMRAVKRAHIAAMVRGLLVCPACRSRAAASGRVPSEHQLSVTAPPFDGHCAVEDFDGDEVSTHYPRLCRSTIKRVLAVVSAAFNVGSRCDEPVCAANPVTGYQLPQFAERPSNEDQTQALSHRELELLAEAHPEHLRAVSSVMAYGLLRRAELFGLDRGDIRWPGSNDSGVARLNIHQVYVSVGGRFQLRQWGKTRASTHPVELAKLASDLLRSHVDTFRSRPSPERCAACAAGTGEWRGKGRNPHRQCDLADDAPLFVDLDGRRQKPNEYTKLFGEIVANVPELAKDVIGFDVRPKTLRATGGTLLLEVGVPDDVVMRMGRWTNIETLKRHYFKMRDAARHDAARRLGDDAAAALGHALADDAPPELRLRAIEHRAQRAETEVERLRGLVVTLGGDPEKPAIQPVRVRRRQSGVWTEENLLAAIDGATTQAEILQRLGVKPAGKHYKKLAAAAARFCLTLPGRWGKAA